MLRIASVGPFRKITANKIKCARRTLMSQFVSSIKISIELSRLAPYQSCVSSGHED